MIPFSCPAPAPHPVLDSLGGRKLHYSAYDDLAPHDFSFTNPLQMSRDPRELIAIFAGGAVGALARAGLSQAWTHGPVSWPWPTFLVNVAGAALLGWLTTRLQERLPPTAYRRPLLATGFCGALTTFSTMQLELLRMLDAHRYALAAGYALSSVVAGVLAAFAATVLTRRVRALA